MSGFILNEGFSLLSGYPETKIYECVFNTKKYSDSLFLHYGIEYHSSLNHAVIGRKSEFLAGRYVCKKALEFFGTINVNIGIGKNRCPLWPTGFKGAITHTDSVALCIVSKSSEIASVGIDRENLIALSLLEEINEIIVCETEKKYLLTLDISMEIAFTIAFSAKECLFKSVHRFIGRYIDFDTAKLVLLEHKGEAGYFVLKVNNVILKSIFKDLYVNGYYILEGNAVITTIVIEDNYLNNSVKIV